MEVRYRGRQGVGDESAPSPYYLLEEEEEEEEV